MDKDKCLLCNKEKPKTNPYDGDTVCAQCRKTLNLIKGIYPTGKATGQRNKGAK